MFAEDERGAYVNVIAWACSEEEFCKKVRKAAADLSCILQESEKVQLLEQRMEETEYPDELITMRATAQRQPDDIVFGTFYTWVQDDRN
jgi:hypothetical protein